MSTIAPTKHVIPGNLMSRDAGVTAFLDRPIVQAIFYAMLATIPFHRFRHLPGPSFMQVDWLLMALLLALIAIPLLVTKVPPARLSGRIWLPLGVFLVINIVSSLLSPQREAAMLGLILLGQMVVFMVVNQLLLNDRGVASRLLWMLAVSHGLNALLAVVGWIFVVEHFSDGVGTSNQRGVGGTISANNMALMCVFVLPLMLYWAIYGRTTARRLIGLCVACLLVGGVVATASRGGFLMLCTVSLLCGWQFRGFFQPRYLGLVLGVAAALPLLFVLIVPASYLERQASLSMLLQRVAGEESQLADDRSLNRRTAYLEVAAEAFWERPFLGHGTESFKAIWVQSEQTRWFDIVERPAHNTYVEVLIGSGLLGLGAFGVLLWVTYRNYREAEQLLASHGDREGAHLAAMYKIAFLAILFYFFVKSGLEHKLFLLAIPLSEAVRRYAINRVRNLAGEAVRSEGR